MQNTQSLFQKIFRSKGAFGSSPSFYEHYNAGKQEEKIKEANETEQKPQEIKLNCKFALSLSKAAQYCDCPLKFYLANVKRCPCPRTQGPAPNLAFDRAIRESLAAFYRQSAINANAPAKKPAEYLNRFWNKNQFNNPNEEAEFKKEAEEALNKYYELFAQQMPKCAKIDFFFKAKIFNTDFNGKIDRLDTLPNDKLEVISYKTGKLPSGGADELNKSVKTLFLLLAANAMWPNKVLKLSYIYIKSGQRFEIELTPTLLSEAKNAYIKLCQNLEQNKFNAQKGSLCGWCDYYSLCPAWQIKPHELAAEPLDKFRQRLRLSYSRLSSFLNCPRAYKKVYVDHLPTAPQPFFSFGTTVHEALERLYEPASAFVKPTLNDLLQLYEQARQNHKEGYSTPEIEEKYRLDGIRHLTMYYNRFIKDKNFVKAHKTEEYFELACGKYAMITGFIDRIDKLPNQTYEILDYKTEPANRSQSDADSDKQLTMYYMACKKLFNLEVSKLSLLMLEFDNKIETTRNDDDCQEITELIDKTACQILNETEYAPKINKYCKSCEYLKDCPLKEEIEHNKSLTSMQKF